MKRSQAFPSKYLSKDDVNPAVIATINSVVFEMIKGDHGDEDKAVMYFQERNIKPMIINNTNWMAIEDVYGDESDNWTGHKVELYVDPGVMFGGKRVGGVRVRVLNGNGNAPPMNTMTLDQAVAACGAVGVSKNELVESLKAKGHSGYNAARDTAHVREIVERVNSRNDQPRTDEEQAIHAGSDIEDDIPF